MPLELSGRHKKKNFLTPGVWILILLALNGLFFLANRFLYGLGAVTNLNDQFPWGLWIGVDVAAGVALAAGGFTSATLAHIMHREEFHVITRPALLTAMLGYTFVALGVCVDIGRWYYIWHPLFFWNPNSALFEVGICVTIYLNVLYIEFLPLITERFIGRVNLPGVLKRLNKPVDGLLRFMNRTLGKTMFIFIIAGTLLSTLHQSSLGTLMIIAGQKIHPLWQTPVLPLLFFLSAVSVGFPMVIFESLIAARSFGIKPEMQVLSKLARYIPPLIGVYLMFKIGDMFVRQSFVHLMVFNIESIMFILELLLFIVPFFLLLFERVVNSPAALFLASALVIAGVVVNRVNNFIIAYHPPYATKPYVPSFGELSVTIGFIALLTLLYRACVMIFPVISVERQEIYAAAGVRETGGIE
ncbi:MAG: Ni/Fe-hydrogenase cytochrome b subunit [Desulfuromonadales bacterium]|nr:Ni/Fe-hydrogenase cytochrome b subunit [Desulfuromonadales bacterium]